MISPCELVPEGLKIKLLEQDGHYLCGEIVSRRSFGYGTYRFTLGSAIDDLAPNLVLGLCHLVRRSGI